MKRMPGGMPENLNRIWKTATNIVLLIFWGWLYKPVFQYLAVLFSREEFRTNQILLVGVAALAVFQARRLSIRPHLDARPHLYLPALGLTLGASLAYLLSEKFLDINTLAAFLFGLATYGLLGLWMSQARWLQGFPVMLLVVGLLPFGEHLETFAGYPLRTFSAALARAGLDALGFHSVGVDTILVFESGISQVDIPCSGVKSLWTGMLFLLAATWIENRRISLHWLLVAMATGLLLVAANLVRVTILALVGPALGWTQLATMIHLPLGVLGFVAVCAAAVYLLRRLPPAEQHANRARRSPSAPFLSRPAWLGPFILLCVVAMALAYSPKFEPQSVAAASPPTWHFSDRILLQSAPLSAKEVDWIQQSGAETADRFTFDWSGGDDQPVTGALMLLTSRTWRGQHRPERCLEVFGLTVEESFSTLLAPDFPVRTLSLSYSDSPQRVSAVYWLQSIDQTTEDFGKRIWSDLGSPQERWVLVTVLFDQTRDPQAMELSGFFAALHDSVAGSLAEGGRQ